MNEVVKFSNISASQYRWTIDTATAAYLAIARVPTA